MKMSWLGLSAALLIVLATLVAGTPGGENKSPAQASWPAFCLEPLYMGLCRAWKIRYFYNSKSGLCKTSVYGGCRGKKNNFLKADDFMKTCGGAVGA
ncbi:Pancreatic trypsin inhibitor, partial [Eschrichtius robustus]|nr:Pancreatic trypsin inhibitor [Eschrichtius robustus]